MSNLYFVRHANASAGEENYDKLSTLGMRQAECLNKFLVSENVHANYIFTGSLIRHKETIQPYLNFLSRINHSYEFIESKSLNEFSPELWNSYAKYLSKIEPEIFKLINLLKKYREKKSVKSKILFYKITEIIIQAWSTNKYNIDGVESYDSFKSRILDFLNILKTTITPHKNAVIITSGTPLAILYSHFLNIDPSNELSWLKRIGNTALSSIQLENDNFFPVNLNSSYHLPLELRTFL